MIYSASVRWPGSAHDSRVYKSSSLCTYLQANDVGLALGDSAYGLSHAMMTPYKLVRNMAQRRFNNAHKKTRSIVEQTIGVWKARLL